MMERITRHRPKIPRRLVPFNACVARPVSPREISSNPDAWKAMEKEWKRLRDQNVWDEEHPRDWIEVRREAQEKGKGCTEAKEYYIGSDDDEEHEVHKEADKVEEDRNQGKATKVKAKVEVKARYTKVVKLVKYIRK